MKFWTTTVCAVFLLGPQTHFSPAVAGDVPDGQRWWSHVAVLADDKLEGRNTGTRGPPESGRVCRRGVRAVRPRTGRNERLSSARAVDLPGDR